MTTATPMYPLQQPAPSQTSPGRTATARVVALVAALAVAGGGYYATHRRSEAVTGNGHGRGHAAVSRSGWGGPLAAFAPLIGSKPGAADAWSSAQCGQAPSSDSAVIANIACTEPDDSTVNVVVFRNASVVSRLVQSAGEQGDDIHSWSHELGTTLGQVVTRSTGRPYVATTFVKHPTVVVEVSGLPDVGALTADWQALPLPR